jgi:3-oxoacyl-[acyl-carrier-protein] synthase II
MASSHDKNGRPIVVVTGMGVITSLGAGKADNWARLTAGESGIHRITRFANDGLKTTIAGSVDFIPVEPFCSTDLGERMATMVAEEAIAESGFPGPAVPGGRAGGDRVAASRRAGGRVRRQRHGRIR